MAVRTDVRIVHMDGTAQGQVLWVAEDVGSMPIPQEFSILRVENRPGKYVVVEQGIAHYFISPEFVTISVFVERVDDDEEDE